MIFRRLHTRDFANLPARWWEFLPGLQLVRGPNEAGKTSLRNALTLALFADAAGRARDVLAYRAWNTTSMRLELEFEHQGRAYRLVRDFEARKNTLQSPDGSPTTSKEQIREKLTAMLVIPTEQAFQATACMAQDSLRIEQPGQIYNLIEKHVVCATGVDVEKLIRGLEKALKDRRKGLEQQAREPGILRQLQDRLKACEQQWDEANKHLQECEEAAEKLAAYEKDLEDAEKRLESRKEGLKRHHIFWQNRQEKERLSRQLLDIEERQKQAQAAEARAAEFGRELAARTPEWEQLRSGVRDAEERARLAAELERVKAEAEKRTAESAAIAELGARLNALHHEVKALPVRADEAENAHYRLPGEMAAQEKALEAHQAEQQQRQAEIASLERAIAEGAARLESLDHDRQLWLAQSNRRTSHAAALAALEDARRQRAALERRLEQLAELDAGIAALQSAAVEAPGNRLRELRTRIEQSHALLAGQAIAVRVEPERPLEAWAKLDGAAERKLDPPEEIVFERQAEVRIPDVVRLTVESRSEAAAALQALEEEYASTLASCGCATWEDFEALEVAQEATSREIVERQAQRQAIAGGQDADELRAQAAELGRAVAEQQEIIAGTVADGPLPESDEIATRLDALPVETQKVQNEQAGSSARLVALREGLGPSQLVRQAEEDLQRRRKILGDILRRAGVNSPADLRPLVEQFARIARDRTAVEEARSALLAGRRAEDVQALAEAAQQRVQQLAASLAGLPDPGWSAEETAARRQDLQRAEEQHVQLREELRQAEAMGAAIDGARLAAQYDEVAVQLVAAKTTAAEYQQFELRQNDQLKVEQEIKSLEEKVREYLDARAECRAAARREEGLREQMLAAEEEMETLTRRMDFQRERDRVDEDVCQVLEAAREAAVVGLRKTLPEFTSCYLATATGGRYQRLEGAGLEAGVFSSEKGGVLEEKELSTGTADQLYLARRLAALRALFGEKTPPLLLDDILVHSDSERRGALLKLLAEFAAQGQVLLFTCQDYPEYASLPTLRM